MVAVAPYAPRFPFETWILPPAGTSRCSRSRRATRVHVAGAAARRHPPADEQGAAEMPPLQPADSQRAGGGEKGGGEYYHWHVEIIPKLTKVAGFEWATGFYLNPTAPEEAARRASQDEASDERRLRCARRPRRHLRWQDAVVSWSPEPGSGCRPTEHFIVPDTRPVRAALSFPVKTGLHRIANRSASWSCR